MECRLVTHSAEETRCLGVEISKHLQRGDVLLLLGDLGAGKTTLVSGIGLGLGVNEKVLSPTFNILKCYFKGRIPLYHIDAYRLENQNIEIGLDEAIEGDGACVIEWPVFIEPLIPSERLEIEIRRQDNGDREFVFHSPDARFGWVELLEVKPCSP